MIRLNKKTKVKLKKLGIGVVYLIGSRASGRARVNSDFDFAIVMQNQKALFKKGELALYHEIYDIFSNALPKIKVNLPYPENMIECDIVFLQTAPLYYSIAARDEGKVLFEISPEFRADYEARVTREYMDFEPFRKEQEYATLAMIE